MSDLFKFPEYPEIDAYREKPKEEEEVIEFGDLTDKLTEVNRIFEAVKSGQSNLVPGALQLVGNSPCYGALERLRISPNIVNISNLVKVVQQDVNRRVAMEVAKIFVGLKKNKKDKIGLTLEELNVS